MANSENIDGNSRDRLHLNDNIHQSSSSLRTHQQSQTQPLHTNSTFSTSTQSNHNTPMNTSTDLDPTSIQSHYTNDTDSNTIRYAGTRIRVLSSNAPIRFAVRYDMPRRALSRALSSRVLWFLECISAIYACILLILLLTLHFGFVRRDGCAEYLSTQLHFHTNDTTNSTHIQSNSVDLIQFQFNFQSETSSVYYSEEIKSAFEQIPFSNTLLSLAPPIHHQFQVSYDRGVLLLSPKLIETYKISMQHITIDSQHQCLGPYPIRSLFEHLIGYETVAVNAFSRLIESQHSFTRSETRWFFKNVDSGAVYSLNAAETTYQPGNIIKEPRRLISTVFNMVLRRFGALITSMFMMCSVGSLVAFALKEVQLRAWKLTIDLQDHIRAQLSYTDVLLRYSLDAIVLVPILIGILFFMFEFFKDHRLAFAVLVVAWLCELFVILSRRHSISLFYLPRLFFAYFLAFHVYYFTYPFGFTWIALLTSVAFMQHAVLMIWNRWEFPLLRSNNAQRGNPVRSNQRNAS